MPSFKFIGDDARVYPDLSLEVEPGQVVDLAADAPADGRWEPTGEPVTLPAVEVAPDPEPAPDPLEPTPEPEPALAGADVTEEHPVA